MGDGEKIKKRLTKEGQGIVVIERVERIQTGKKGKAKKVLVARMKMKSDSFSSSIFGLSTMSRYCSHFVFVWKVSGISQT